MAYLRKTLSTLETSTYLQGLFDTGVTSTEFDLLDGVSALGDVTLAGSQTLTNKTLTAPIFSGIPSGTCSFMVRMGGGIWRTPGADLVLTFDGDSAGEGHDTDGCWNTSSFRFTAPATGLYLFWYSIYTANTDGSNAFHLLKNGSDVNSTDDGANLMTHSDAGASDHMQTATMLLNLVNTDYIQFAAEKQSDYYTGHCSAGGCRVR